MRKNIEIIANKCSGKGNGAKCLAVVEAYLCENGVPYRVHETHGVGHGKELAARLCAEGADTVVALGGDGTLHEVLNGMDFTSARMGIIPAGRGNDFALGTRAASLDPKTAISDIVRGVPRDLDYLRVGSKRCINVAGTGLDVEVLNRTAKSKNKLTYVASLFRCLLRFKPYRVEITAEGETTVCDCIMVGVCNGSQFGGGIKLCPPAFAGDGKLDLIAITKPKNLPTVFFMPTFVKGKHLGWNCVRHIVCDSVKVVTEAPIELDGEIYRDVDFDAEIVAGGLKTFAATEK